MVGRNFIPLILALAVTLSLSAAFFLKREASESPTLLSFLGSRSLEKRSESFSDGPEENITQEVVAIEESSHPVGPGHDGFPPGCAGEEIMCLMPIDIFLRPTYEAVHGGVPMDFSESKVNDFCNATETARQCLRDVGNCSTSHLPLTAIYDSFDYLCSESSRALYPQLDGTTCDSGALRSTATVQDCESLAYLISDKCDRNDAVHRCTVLRLTSACGNAFGQFVQGFLAVQEPDCRKP